MKIDKFIYKFIDHDNKKIRKIMLIFIRESYGKFTLDHFDKSGFDRMIKSVGDWEYALTMKSSEMIAEKFFGTKKAYDFGNYVFCKEVTSSKSKMSNINKNSGLKTIQIEDATLHKKYCSTYSIGKENEQYSRASYDHMHKVYRFNVSGNSNNIILDEIESDLFYDKNSTMKGGNWNDNNWNNNRYGMMNKSHSNMNSYEDNNWDNWDKMGLHMNGKMMNDDMMKRLNKSHQNQDNEMMGGKSMNDEDYGYKKYKAKYNALKKKMDREY